MPLRKSVGFIATRTFTPSEGTITTLPSGPEQSSSTLRHQRSAECGRPSHRRRFPAPLRPKASAPAPEPPTQQAQNYAHAPSSRSREAGRTVASQTIAAQKSHDAGRPRTLRPAASVSSTISAFSSVDQRRRPPVPKKTSTRRVALEFGSNLWSSRATCRSQNQRSESAHSHPEKEGMAKTSLTDFGSPFRLSVLAVASSERRRSRAEGWRSTRRLGPVGDLRAGRVCPSVSGVSSGLKTYIRSHSPRKRRICLLVQSTDPLRRPPPPK
jgi:hypothetical protein